MGDMPRDRICQGHCLYVGASAGCVLAGHHGGYCVDAHPDDPTGSRYPPTELGLDLLGGPSICAYHEDNRPFPEVFQRRQAVYPDEPCVRMGPRISLIRIHGGALEGAMINPRKRPGKLDPKQIEYTQADIRKSKAV